MVARTAVLVLLAISATASAIAESSARADTRAVAFESLSSRAAVEPRADASRLSIRSNAVDGGVHVVDPAYGQDYEGNTLRQAANNQWQQRSGPKSAPKPFTFIKNAYRVPGGVWKGVTCVATPGNCEYKRGCPPVVKRCYTRNYRNCSRRGGSWSCYGEIYKPKHSPVPMPSSGPSVDKVFY